ncbi:CpaF family protein [Nostocoides sp. F2B08]|uniref:CpaF family protein n=1 Tax=Nostocoides sp. F2B08 TaxID=2653936 RepID=UPI001262B567|nr:ATPase, T2SS/T4P/T4SS family [Tetrasphaera sp. F2B08]KAB7740340.1 CpaF family protein [Tetrasphaera sp. F2B08]
MKNDPTDHTGAGGASSDPAALPLFTASPPRAGRVRGTFTMTPTTATPSSPGTPTREHTAATGHLNGQRNGHAPRLKVTPQGASGSGWAGQEGLDWGLVAAFRTMVANRLTQALGADWRARTDPDIDHSRRGGSSPDRVEQEQVGREIIADLLRDHTADSVAKGLARWTASEQATMGQAVFDAVFRLGRLQPLVDDDRVENIFILGHQRVLLELTDGSRIPGPAVADSDEELLDFLRFLANRSESNPRPFSESTPRLHMKLDGGARLAATAWVVGRPTVVIRRHRLKVDTLDAWVERGCMTAACANFLAAAVRARWSVAVSGAMSAGKTTLMRALCAQIPGDEAIGTFETEYELFLAESGVHDIVIDWEARPGVGEVRADGRAAGAFDLADALTDSFRFALSRQIVGEIRGPEVWTMIKAMESGTGSLSTTHAANAEACIRKLVTCAMEAGSHVNRDLALEKLAGCLEVIVQLSRQVVQLPDGSQQLRRWVSEVVVVEPGEREKGYALTHLFGPSSTGPATATGIISERCRTLAEQGFDQALFQAEADQAAQVSR